MLTACGERTDGLYGIHYSRSELEEMGVNTEHLFIFDGDKITYNGKEFWPGMSIKDTLLKNCITNNILII